VGPVAGKLLDVAELPSEIGLHRGRSVAGVLIRPLVDVVDLPGGADQATLDRDPGGLPRPGSSRPVDRSEQLDRLPRSGLGRRRGTSIPAGGRRATGAAPLASRARTPGTYSTRAGGLHHRRLFEYRRELLGRNHRNRGRREGWAARRAGADFEFAAGSVCPPALGYFAIPSGSARRRRGCDAVVVGEDEIGVAHAHPFVDRLHQLPAGAERKPGRLPASNSSGLRTSRNASGSRRHRSTVPRSTAGILLKFVTQVAARFGLVVTQKVAAQAFPVVGALGGRCGELCVHRALPGGGPWSFYGPPARAALWQGQDSHRI
jgi:hypothetical protein